MTGHAERPEAVVCLATGRAQVVVLHKARERGFAVIGVDRDPGAPGWKLCDERLVCSTYESGPILAGLRPLLGRYTIVGVLNRSSGPPTVTAAEIAEALGLPGVPPRSARTILDKSRLLAACRACGIPTPAFQSMARLDEADPLRLTFPAVVKPAVGRGGRKGVRVVGSRTELPSAFDEARSHSLNRWVNIEEHVPGHDLSMLAVVDEHRLRVLALLDEINRVDEEGRVHPHAMAVPSRYEGTAAVAAAVDIADRLVRRFELGTSPFLLSCRVESGRGPRLIELQLDIGGDLVLDRLLPACTSFDVLGHVVDTMTGRAVPPPIGSLRPAAVIYGDGYGGPRIVHATDRQALEAELDVAIEETVLA